MRPCCPPIPPPDDDRHRSAMHGLNTGMVRWLHTAGMGECALAVHPPCPLMTTDTGLPRIVQHRNGSMASHCLEMGECALAVHLPCPLTSTQVATAHPCTSYSIPRHPCFGDRPLVSLPQTVCPLKCHADKSPNMAGLQSKTRPFTQHPGQ